MIEKENGDRRKWKPGRGVESENDWRTLKIEDAGKSWKG